MRIDLSNPDAVWQAANPILTQPNAVAIFAKALELLPPGEHSAASLHRIRLEMCQALALFSASQIRNSLAVVRTALQRAAQIPMPMLIDQAPVTIDTEAGLTLLRHTLVGLAAQGLPAFATAGALLGLVREGRLLPNDKDLDVVLPFQHLPAAINALPALGWKPGWTVVKATNFRSYVHTRHAITLDLFGYDFDTANACVWGGWWPLGLPREQGRLLKFTPIELVLAHHPWGQHWDVRHPDNLLAQLYGPIWRTPDAEFDSTVEIPALVAHNDYTRTWAALRLLEAWVQGHAGLTARRLRTLARMADTDPVVHAFASPLAHPLPC
jgi:hypothetical protein